MKLHKKRRNMEIKVNVGNKFSKGAKDMIYLIGLFRRKLFLEHSKCHPLCKEEVYEWHNFFLSVN